MKVERPTYAPHHMMIISFMAITSPVAVLSYIYTLASGRASPKHVLVLFMLRMSLTAAVALVCSTRFVVNGAKATAGMLFRAVAPFAVHGLLYAEAAFLCAHTLGLQRQFGDWAVAQLDIAMFRCDPVGGCTASLRSMLPWRAFGEYMYFCYFSYYFLLPLLWLRALTVYRQCPESFERVCFISFACVLSPFIIYYLLPVRGPESVYGIPAAEEGSWFFGHLCNSLVSGNGSAGTATPSSHSIMALGVWACAYTIDRHTFAAYAAVCPGLLLATVWCGYHYVVDVIASAVLCAGVLWVAPRMYDSLCRCRLD